MFAIANGRKALWQWDLNQQLTVAGSCTEVHYLDKGAPFTLTVAVKDGKADIPNVLLQRPGRLVVYAYIVDAQDHHTKTCETFGISARPKPDDYVYTETEVKTWNDLKSQIGDLADLETEAKENLVAAINEAAKSGGESYTLPQATAESLGGVKADSAEATDTQPVRIGTDGKLYTAPGGTDISLGLTSAAVGQIIKVKAIDESGKPTEWDAADMSEGVALDTTLTQSGQAADAKAVGDALAKKQSKGDYLTRDNLQSATDAALEQAKASGEFDGADGITPHIGDNGNWYLGDTDTGKPSRGDTGATGPKGDKGADGKSAYQYAQDGGYTGTEEEFAEKLAQEKFVNPNALTFTGAVEGSYDGSAPLSVEIPSGGEKWETILDLTLEEDVNEVVLMSGDVGYKKIMIYMDSVPPTDQTVTSNQAISVYSKETTMFEATAKLNGAYLYNGNRLSGASIELTPYAANVFTSGSGGWYDSGTPTEVKMGYSSKNSLSKPIKELTAQVWGNALFGVGSWFKVYGVRV